MHRDEQDLIIIIKERLGAIAMMDVPVKNADPLSLIPGIFGRYAHVVENAEAGRLAAACMVAGWPYYTISPLYLLCLPLIL